MRCRRTKASLTARFSPSSRVKRSRSQSQLAPRRRSWPAMPPWCLSFHCPAGLHELLAADGLAAGALVAQLALDLELGGDAGVVGAGHPQRRAAAHALVADHQVLQRDEQGVALVQHAGHVGRRDGDHEGLGVGAGRLGLEPALLPPTRRRVAARRRQSRRSWACRMS